MSFTIETKDLSKRFPQFKSYSELLLHPFQTKEFLVLSDINLQVKKGEIFCLLGPNGAGKTTLIKVLCTLILPTSGKAFVNGYDVVKEHKSVRKTIGFIVSDERSFYWRLTGRQNLSFFSILNNLPKPAYEKRIEQILSLLQLHGFADKMFKDYSTGTKQRFAIARGLLTNPDILFMDEPTRSLDPSTANHLRKFIKEVLVEEGGKTVFLATHNTSEAEEIAHRIAIIHEGQIKLSGSLQEIRRQLKQRKRIVIKLENSKHQLERIKESIGFSNGVSLSTDDNGCWYVDIDNGGIKIADIIKKIVQVGGRIQFCKQLESNLSEIYDEVIQ